MSASRWLLRQLEDDAAERGLSLVFSEDGSRVVGRTRFEERGGKRFLVWHHDGFGERRCTTPLVRNASNFSENWERCGRCPGCLAHKFARSRREFREALERELLAAEASYWFTLTFAQDVTRDFMEAACKQFLKVLRLGRCRSRPPILQEYRQPKGAMGLRHLADGQGLHFDPARLPVVPVPRTRKGRDEAGFIKGDPALRYTFVDERTKAGRLHVHGLVHCDPALIPPGALLEAWPHGLVRVRRVRKSAKDAAKLSRYLSKYMSKQAGKEDVGRSEYFRMSRGYGKVRADG